MPESIVSLLSACEAARPAGEGGWIVADDTSLSLLAELGRGLVALERVRRVQLREGVAIVVTAKETHYLPAARLVGLKVQGTPAGLGPKPRAGFV